MKMQHFCDTKKPLIVDKIYYDMDFQSWMISINTTNGLSFYITHCSYCGERLEEIEHCKNTDCNHPMTLHHAVYDELEHWVCPLCTEDYGYEDYCISKELEQ